jgi:rifampicin phosphotransferase
MELKRRREDQEMGDSAHRRLSEIDRRDIGAYGSKAVALGELCRHGYNVPAGFVLPVSFGEAFLRADGFPYDPCDYAAYSIEIRELVGNYSFQPELADAIQQCTAELRSAFPEDPVVVRTSALCEDRRQASMAGAFASFAELLTPDQVRDAVRGCYSSLFSDAVLDRYAAGTISNGDLKAGVIIQRYVAGDVSGVMFTADARQMDPAVAVISAVRGPCSGVTDGSVPATTYSCRKESGAVQEVHGDTHVLSDGQVAELVSHAVRIETHFGYHQDIEWTISQGQLHILQSRPVTGFREPPDPTDWDDGSIPDAGKAWKLKNDTCLPPLFAELQVEAENQSGACAYSYGMHWDASEMMARHGYLYQRNRAVPDSKARLDTLLERLNTQFDQGEDEFDKHVRPELAGLIDTLHKSYIDRPESETDLAAYLRDAEFFMKRGLRLHWRATTSEWYMGHFFRSRVERFFDALGLQDLVDMVYSKSLMTEEREKLYEMVEVVQADPDLSGLFAQFEHDRIIAARLDRLETDASRRLRQLLDTYSREHGWLEDYDLTEGSLRRRGTVPRVECVNRVRRYLHVSLDDYRTNLQQMADNATRLRAEGLDKCASDEDRASLEMALKAGEKAFLAGDNHAFYICARKYVYICDAVTRISEVLVKRGQIGTPEDIRFLHLEEIRAALANGDPQQERIAQRQEAFEHWRTVLPPERIGPEEADTADHKDDGNAKADETRVIKGESGTRKDARGRVHVGFPREPLDGDIILVLEHGHEGDLTTILGHVAGLVVKAGTPASHMGIIARELGIPAIYAVGDAVSLLKPGDEVALRGRTGEIVLQSGPAQ